MIIVDHDKCNGCGICVRICPEDAIDTTWGTAVINERQCTDCGACVDNCPEKALSWQRNDSIITSKER